MFSERSLVGPALTLWLVASPLIAGLAGCHSATADSPSAEALAQTDEATPVAARPDADAFDPLRYEKEILVRGLHDPMQIHVLDDGQIYFHEIHGKLKHYDPQSGEVTVVGEMPSVRYGEVGFMGLALDNDFATNGRIYTLYCPRAKRDHLRLSRFEIRAGRLELDSERMLFEYPIDPQSAAHMGGGMMMTPDGLLYIGTGDNCTPIPELPVDQRDGFAHNDALRSSGNSRDLRGKVLRIRPTDDGGYEVPADNLFPDGKQGRAEIYAMGVRNAFRLFVDPQTKWVYWGDVGPNIRLDFEVGPNGYDEVNQARAAGNFGWPMFTGPNEAYRWWDFATRTRGRWFEVDNPVNDSRNNTGLRRLPPPQPAFIWYPTTESPEFPELGSGGRAAMCGPIYRYDAALDSPVKLPAALDGRLLIYDWTRNWIKQVVLDDEGRIERIEPFLDHMLFRKPIDMKFRSDGTLYVIEYGDRWGGNTDAQIVRIVYRRGNRPPVAVVRADRSAGKEPLTVRLDAGDSHDRDRDDRLRYEWRVGPLPEVVSTAAKFETTFSEPGVYDVELTAIDAMGAQSTAKLEIRVGNTPPVVRILEPPHGSFFEWKEPLLYAAEVDDAEDGSTAAAEASGRRIDPARLVVRTKYQQRRASTDVDALGQQLVNDDATLEPGLAMMRRTTCFACHMARNASAGPPYEQVARKYQGDASARERLAKKIISGGVGVWGVKPMPPHPQHTLAETRQMVDWVLSLAHSSSSAPLAGTRGAFRAIDFPDIRADAGVYVITASYTDEGAAGVPPLTGQAVHLLHSRKKKAAFFDTRRGAEIVDEYEGEHTIVGRFADGDYVSFAQIRLTDVAEVSFRAGALGDVGGRFEIRQDGPEGPQLAAATMKPSVGYQYQKVPIRDPGGVHDLYVVAVVDEALPGDKSQPAEGATGKTSSKPDRGHADSAKVLGLNWIGFHLTPAAQAAREARIARAEAKLAEQAELARRQTPPPRPFVKNWVRDDLIRDVRDLHNRVGEIEALDQGGRLFRELACAACHRAADVEQAAIEQTAIGQAAAERVWPGPALTDIAKKYQQAPQPGLSVLDAVLEPSAQIDERFRTQMFFLESGRQVVGMVVADDDETITVVENPLATDRLTVIRRADIEEQTPSAVSLMPAGLLTTLSREEIVALLTYVLAGGADEAAGRSP
ncbi:MAG: PKD domain-containing protein [Planctomycetota bacterium]|nr:MAG: PKD domain-containing protein [Planctomycetota bacterium]REK47132.1 MAG: PKD domain-containing protein [Planctomycetota bacterium]